MSVAKKPSLLNIFFGGILPVVAFTLVENYYGIIWGAIAGMAFGVGEIIYEKFFLGKVSKLTLVVNMFIFILGAVSIVMNDGIWFKLQPAFIETGFSLILFISLLRKKPLLPNLAKMQGHQLAPAAEKILTGMTFRLGIFFTIHAVLATWAAFSWTTEQWAWLKGVGLTVSFILYFGFEFVILRILAKRR